MKNTEGACLFFFRLTPAVRADVRFNETASFFVLFLTWISNHRWGVSLCFTATAGRITRTSSNSGVLEVHDDDERSAFEKLEKENWRWLVMNRADAAPPTGASNSAYSKRYPRFRMHCPLLEALCNSGRCPHALCFDCLRSWQDCALEIRGRAKRRRRRRPAASVSSTIAGRRFVIVLCRYVSDFNVHFRPFGWVWRKKSGRPLLRDGRCLYNRKCATPTVKTRKQALDRRLITRPFYKVSWLNRAECASGRLKARGRWPFRDWQNFTWKKCEFFE